MLSPKIWGGGLSPLAADYTPLLYLGQGRATRTVPVPCRLSVQSVLPSRDDNMNSVAARSFGITEVI
ncbi:hypothetical protein J6590_044692 [Homalodisca vitripennis]|nr:hypothetical protein J6590_044692 [Homalodisca vitripennis]